MKKFLYHGKKNICGDRIRMARLEKRLSQTDLARLLQLEGVPMERDVISRMEMGDRLSLIHICLVYTNGDANYYDANNSWAVAAGFAA